MFIVGDQILSDVKGRITNISWPSVNQNKPKTIYLCTLPLPSCFCNFVFVHVDAKLQYAFSSLCAKNTASSVWGQVCASFWRVAAVGFFVTCSYIALTWELHLGLLFLWVSQGGARGWCAGCSDNNTAQYQLRDNTSWPIFHLIP